MLKNGEYTINKEIIRELEENYRFTDKITFKNYDYLTVNGIYLEFYAEPVYEQGDDGFYSKVCDSVTVSCRKDNLSGVYVPTYFK